MLEIEPDNKGKKVKRQRQKHSLKRYPSAQIAIDAMAKQWRFANP